MRKEAEGVLSRKEFREKRERAGIVAMVSDLDQPAPEIHDLNEGRHEVELAVDAMKNHLDADKTHLQSDEAVRGYCFVTLLGLRVYFAVLQWLREHGLNQRVSVAEVFWEFRKVRGIKKPGDREAFAQMPKRARDLLEVFPEAMPMA